MAEQPLISIVDDDESVGEATKNLMRTFGFVAETFRSAEEFLRSDCRRRTACLIADVKMPRMTGLELHRHLVASGNPIPTILMTAYPDDRVRSLALQAGIIGYMAKPFAETEMLACINTALGR